MAADHADPRLLSRPQLVALPLLLFGLVIATAIQSEADDNRATRFLETVLFPIFLLLIVAIWDWTSYLVSELQTPLYWISGSRCPSFWRKPGNLPKGNQFPRLTVLTGRNRRA